MLQENHIERNLEHKHSIIMKNLFRLLFGTLALVAIVGCEAENNMSEGDKSNALSMPNATATVMENEIVVAWDAVEFAIAYDLTLNGGEAVRVDNSPYRFSGLDYATTYTITVMAISADPETCSNSEPKVLNVEIPALDIHAYREWYSASGAIALSNNGRWAVGGFQHNGFIYDLQNNKQTELAGMEFEDVSDNGIAVGVYFISESDGGSAMYYKDGEHHLVDLGELPEQLYCSALTGITPDGTYAVGWYWDYAQTYYTERFGLIVPFAYDIEKNKVIVLKEDTLYAQYRTATQTYGVDPNRAILGLEQSDLGMFGVLWENDAADWQYVYMKANEYREPIEAFGSVGRCYFSPNGRYIFNAGATYENGVNYNCAAAFDRESNEMIWFESVRDGGVSAMTDDGIAFLNDVSAGFGSDVYVIDTNKDVNTVTRLSDWLLSEHNLDLTGYIIEGSILVGVSDDGRTLLGMTNTVEYGWVNFVIDLDGKPMPEKVVEEEE